MTQETFDKAKQLEAMLKEGLKLKELIEVSLKHYVDPVLEIKRSDSNFPCKITNDVLSRKLLEAMEVVTDDYLESINTMFMEL